MSLPAALFCIDGGSATLGWAVIPVFPEACGSEILQLGTETRSSRRESYDARMDWLCARVWNALLSAHAIADIQGFALEKPTDVFDQNRHDTMFVNGRTFERLWLLGRQSGLPCYDITPQEEAEALSLQPGVPKAQRHAALLNLVRNPSGKPGSWSTQKTRLARIWVQGDWQEHGPDALDACVVGWAARGIHRQRQLEMRTGARVRRGSAPNAPGGSI